MSQDPVTAAAPAQNSVEFPLVHDGVLSFSRIERFDGGPGAASVAPGTYLQILHELNRSALGPTKPFDLSALRSHDDEARQQRLHPMSLVHAVYERTRASTQDSRTTSRSQHEVLALGILRPYTYQGRAVTFVFPSPLYFGNVSSRLRQLQIDFDDGQGFVPLDFDRHYTIRYHSPGRKQLRLRAAADETDWKFSAADFIVHRLTTPVPQDTLILSSPQIYQGQAASGQAYVYLSEAHTNLTRPVIVIEGFDLENNMDWEPLYVLLNQENLIEEIRLRGYDAVVLDFDDATDFIQRNAFLVVELLQQVQNLTAPGQEMLLMGASMGGLVGRYALSWMESQSLPYQVTTFISFDAPQRGANIPLGIQYWLTFFAEDSAEAQQLLQALSSPAARQMLVYFQTDPPNSSPASDPLRDELMSEFSAFGGYPVQSLNVGIANGSGFGMDQGFAAGDQIIHYEYDSFLVDVRGNVWAVPESGTQQIFEGLINPILLPSQSSNVSVSGTKPFDNAPGGRRSSMMQMDESQAPFGDIVALHPDHCFIPTISALDLATDDPFYDIAGDADLAETTSFDVVHYPSENQPHVSITPESASWFLSYVPLVPSDAAVVPTRGVALRNNYPNPFNPSTRISFSLESPTHARLAVYSVDGRKVKTLHRGWLGAGEHSFDWRGTNELGRDMRSGYYLYELRTPTGSQSKPMVLLR